MRFNTVLCYNNTKGDGEMATKRPAKKTTKQTTKKATQSTTKPKKTTKRMTRKKSNKKKRLKFKYILLCLLLLFFIVSIYGVMKPLPAGINKEYSAKKTDDVTLLLDQTYEENGQMIYNHEIFNNIFQMIDEAEDFVMIDMFLFNDMYNGEKTFPKLSSELTNHLIERKKERPNIRIYVLTDPVNSLYRSFEPKYIKQLRDNGIDVYETELKKLRDSNPLYSGFWRSTFGLFGNGGTGVIPNLFEKEAPKSTVRGMAELLNFKANHRKTIVTERHAIIASSNPHDLSGHHQNIALKVRGAVLQDLIKSEIAAINMSGGMLDDIDFPIEQPNYSNTMDYSTQLVTEGRIHDAILKEINQTHKGDEIKIGMFYLSERQIIKDLIKASSRGVDIRLILDVNKEAFGKEKPGVPNKPVAHELVAKSNQRIKVKWAVSHGEQFHAKYMLVNRVKEKSSTLIVGSANFTRRNLNNLNMETDIVIVGESKLDVFEKLNKDFDNKWFNTYAHVTDHYNVKKDPSYWKNVLYRFQEWSGLSSF